MLKWHLRTAYGMTPDQYRESGIAFGLSNGGAQLRKPKRSSLARQIDWNRWPPPLTGEIGRESVSRLLQTRRPAILAWRSAVGRAEWAAMGAPRCGRRSIDSGVRSRAIADRAFVH